MTLEDAKRRLRMVDRAVKRGQGKLRQSSDFAHSVAIGSDMITIGAGNYFGGPYHAHAFDFPVLNALEDTVHGEHEVWFDQDGNAFIGFADKQDATLFRLALDGDLS